MKILKILRPALSLLICIAAIVVCLTVGQNFRTNHASTNHTSPKTLRIGDYSYSVTDYSYYGGDAYTGIQQAGADTSNNVVVLGITVTDAANMLYDAQKNAANNVAALAAPINVTMTNVAVIGAFLSTAIAFAFALPGVKSLLDLIQIVLEIRQESAAKAVPAEPKEEAVCEEMDIEKAAEEPAEAVPEEA